MSERNETSEPTIRDAGKVATDSSALEIIQAAQQLANETNGGVMSADHLKKVVNDRTFEALSASLLGGVCGGLEDTETPEDAMEAPEEELEEELEAEVTPRGAAISALLGGLAGSFFADDGKLTREAATAASAAAFDAVMAAMPEEIAKQMADDVELSRSLGFTRFNSKPHGNNTTVELDLDNDAVRMTYEHSTIVIDLDDENGQSSLQWLITHLREVDNLITRCRRGEKMDRDNFLAKADEAFDETYAESGDADDTDDRPENESIHPRVNDAEVNTINMVADLGGDPTRMNDEILFAAAQALARLGYMAAVDNKPGVPLPQNDIHLAAKQWQQENVAAATTTATS